MEFVGNMTETRIKKYEVSLEDKYRLAKNQLRDSQKRLDKINHARRLEQEVYDQLLSKFNNLEASLYGGPI